MKRPVLLGGLLILTAWGCGPSETPTDTAPKPAAPTTAAQPSTPQPSPGSIPSIPNLVDGDPPHFQNTIIMTANGGVPGVAATAPCIGTATMYRMVGVKRKHKIRWHIQNDPYNPCVGLQISQVEVRFTNSVLAQDESVQPSATAISNAAPSGSNTFIQVRIHADATRAPNNPHTKYRVFYQGQEASPDPEVDVDGSCGGCGPGGS